MSADREETGFQMSADREKTGFQITADRQQEGVQTRQYGAYGTGGYRITII